MNLKKTKQLVYGYLKVNLRKTVITVMILCSIIVSYIIINQSFLNIQEANLVIAEKNYGSWHFNYKYAANDEYFKFANDNKLEQVACEWLIGSTDTNVLLLYRDLSYNKLCADGMELLEGHMPQEIEEIALTKSYIDKLGYSIGDKIKYSYEKVDYSSGETLYNNEETFIISGIVEDYSFDHTIDIGLVSEKCKNSFGSVLEIENLYAAFRDTKNIENQVQEICKAYGIDSNIKLNNELIFVDEDNGVYKWVNLVINIIIWGVSALLVYNILYFKLMGEKKDLGILRSIGFENKDLKKVIYGEISVLLLISIPIGIILGVMLNEIFYHQIIASVLREWDTNAVSLNSSVSTNIIGQVIVLVLLTVIPAIIIPLKEIGKLTPTALRNSREDNATSAKTGMGILLKINGNKFYRYGVKNLVRNRKRTIVTISSIFLSVMIISLLLLTDAFNIGDGSWIKIYIPEDIRITSENRRISKELVNELANVEGIEQIEASQIDEVWLSIPTEYLNKESELYKGFSNETKEANVEVDEEGTERFCFNVTAVGGNQIETYLEQKNIAKNCIVVDQELYDLFKSTSLNKEIEAFYRDDMGQILRTETVKIENVIDKFPFMPEEGMGVSRIFIDEATMSYLTQTYGYNRLDIRLEDPSDVAPVIAIKQLDEIKENCIVSTYKDRVNAYMLEAKKQLKLQIVLIGVFFLIAVFNLFNTIINNLINRTREFYNLKVIGITRQEIFTGILWENIFYSILAVGLSSILQVFILAINIIFNLGLHPPMLGYILLDVLMIISNFFLIIYGYHCSRKFK